MTAKQPSLETGKLANMTIGIAITIIVISIIIRFAFIALY